METDSTKKTCEQRIDNRLRSRLEQFLPQVNAWGTLRCARYIKSEGRETDSTAVVELRNEVLGLIGEQACEQLLSVEKVISYKLCLSWGGPADYFSLNWSQSDSAWVSGSYIFQDWFDSADRPISSDQAAQLAELFGIYPDVA